MRAKESYRHLSKAELLRLDFRYLYWTQKILVCCALHNLAVVQVIEYISHNLSYLILRSIITLVLDLSNNQKN